MIIMKYKTKNINIFIDNKRYLHQFLYGLNYNKVNDCRIMIKQYINSMDK